MQKQLSDFIYHECGEQKFIFNIQSNDANWWFKHLFLGWGYRLNYTHKDFCPKSLKTLICESLKTLICELGKRPLQSLNLMKKKEVGNAH